MERLLSKSMRQYGDTYIHPGQPVWATHEAGIRNSSTSTWAIRPAEDAEPLEHLDWVRLREGFIRKNGSAIDSVLTVAEACELLGVNKARVGQLLDGGHLLGRKAGGTWLLDRKSVELRAQYQNDNPR